LLVDFAISSVLLAVLLLVAGVTARPTWLLLPLIAVLIVVAAIAVGVWLAALNVRYRDVRYAIPFLVQIWFFASPVVYSAQLVSDQWQTLYSLNPMVGFLEAFRWALFGTGAPSTSSFGVSVVVTITILMGGLLYFRRVERTFSDVI
jgi:lipopolysaccharide transport system permease protein